MKRRGFAFWAISVFTACSASQKPPVDHPAPAPSPTPAPVLANETERIGRVERGLLPTVQVKGEDTGLALEARMVAHHVPGVSITVWKDYRPLWTRNYGFTDAATKQPVTAATLFQAASISKPVTALTALLSAERGQVQLDVPINRVLKSWQLPENDFTRATPVTLRQLLSHTAGTTVHGFPGYAEGETVPTLLQVLDGTPPANSPPVRVDMPPGQRARYSGGGYCIAQQALIDQTGLAFPELAATQVLKPFGMQSSTFQQPLPAALLPHAAAGHDHHGGVIPGKRHTYPELAPAGLWTTSADLAQFFIELQLARAGKSHHLSQAVAQKMTTGVAPAGAAQVGHGIFLFSKQGAAYFGHGGANAGFQAVGTAGLDTGYGVVIMTNGENGRELANEIERAVAREYSWDGQDPVIERAALTSEQSKAISGRYTSGVWRAFTITPKGNGLELHWLLGNTVELVPVANNAFVARDDGTELKLDASGAQLALTSSHGPPETATRVPDHAKSALFELEAGREDVALAELRKLQRSEPNNPELSAEMIDDLSSELLFQGTPLPRVLPLLRINVALHPDSALALGKLADALAQAQDTKKALASYQALLKVLARDKATPDAVKQQLRKKAEAQLAQLKSK